MKQLAYFFHQKDKGSLMFDTEHKLKKYRTCQRKKKHALLEANQIIKKNPQDKLSTYLCPFCQNWHLTHKPLK